ncbi:MAG: mechanosensitive ion channel protein MscS [Flavobacteriales bacterium]|nr:mechanosensitive ion channel protein MscS [Flavobacteriales bacterium]|tara:strand:+ start:328 stop:1488 length:1161 start_codon:yes stop_codon:yes gene_type:complete
MDLSLENIKEFLSQNLIWGNTNESILIFISSIILGLIFKGIISKYLSHYLYKIIGKKETRLGVEKFDNLLTKPISFFVMLIIIFIGSSKIQLPYSWPYEVQIGDSIKYVFGIKMILYRGFSLIIIYSIFRIALRIIDFIGLIFIQKAQESENKMDDQLVPFAIEIVKFLAWIIAISIVLSNVFKIEIGAVIAGLGIGGIALAMASKESLENLLGSFTIFIDKPFTVGDLVTVGNITGVVEKVGFRSTRIRTFDKSLVTLPNKKMIDAELDNLGLRPIRRIKFSIGLTYNTSVDQIKKIVSDIQTMIDSHPNTTSPNPEETNDERGRVRFQEFGSSSLDILVLYYVNSPGWDDLINVRQEINYKIMEIVKENGSDFAFPSTTVYLEK